MPLYDYVCEKGHTQEITHAMDELPRLYCHCGKPLAKAVSFQAVKFNGPGFYSTDYK
jgi:putative FmdB family regulatory protein